VCFSYYFRVTQATVGINFVGVPRGLLLSILLGTLFNRQELFTASVK
jgi:hypothetical protein